MALKRSAREAFGKPKAQISAFAAARQARQTPQAEADDQQLYDAEIFLGDNNQNLVDQYDERTLLENLPDEEEPATGPISIKTPPVKLSTFLPTHINVQRDDEASLELILRAEETLAVVGEYDVQVLVGVATVYGTLLHPDIGRQRVYAPSIQALTPIASRKDDTVVRLTSVRSGMQCLDRLSPAFRNIWALDEVKGRSFAVLSSSDDDALQRSLSLLEVDDESKKTLSRLNARYEDDDGTRPIIMAIGSKSAGKSTFNRLLCNMIHSRWPAESCLYLDLDPGQPEFGPPGQLSLVEVKAPILGPSFSHPAGRSTSTYRLIRSHAIAAMSFKDDPAHYTACVIDLFRHACLGRKVQSLPIVVNSCGWVSGLGATTISQICREIRVTDIIQLGSVGEGLADSLIALGCIIHPIPRRLTRPSVRAPAELRAMQTMAYFHYRFRTSVALSPWNDKSLSLLRPWEVSYQSDSPGIHAVLSYGQTPSPDFLAEVLDGSIVALVSITPGLLDDAAIARTPIEDLPYMQPDEHGISSALDPQHSQCVGLALVRGIDVSVRRVLLTVPLPDPQVAELGQQQVVLVRGNFDSPDWAYFEDLHAGKDVTGSMGLADEEQRPWVTRKERAGVEGAVWRLRHPPVASSVHK